MSRPVMRRTRVIKATDNSRRMAVRSISGKKRSDSRQYEQEDDLDDTFYTRMGLIRPPYSVKKLIDRYNESNMVPTCAEAMITNVTKYGVQVKPREKGVIPNEKEQKLLKDFVKEPYPMRTLASIMVNINRWYERIGWGNMEVMRDKAGRITSFVDMPSHKMELSRLGKELVEVTHRVQRGDRVVPIKVRKRFRKWVVHHSKLGEVTWYKEFGDPRDLNYKTGEFGTRESPVPEDLKATEVLCFSQQSEGPYGVPRWVHHIPSILGSRKAELLNLDYFDNNTVPPLLMTVSGGRLTRDSYDMIQKVIQEGKVGKDRQNMILIIEAVPEAEGLDQNSPPVKIDVDPLTEARQQDGLFVQYDGANQAKIRSGYRLPPAAIGLSQDTTFATANVSQFIAETQVYGPERRYFEEVMNMNIVHNQYGLGLDTVRLELQGPTLTSPDQVIKATTALNSVGAFTPRDAVKIANEMMGMNTEQYPEKGEEGYEEWMDRPIVLAVGRKSQALQATKDEETKGIEEDGEINREPENGSE